MMAYDLWGFAAKCPYYGAERSKCLNCTDGNLSISMDFPSKDTKTAYRKRFCDSYDYDMCGLYNYLNETGGDEVRQGRSDKFAEALRKHGYTQKQLADELLMSESSLSLKLCGKRTMTVQEAAKIEQLIGISAQDLAQIINAAAKDA